MKYDLFLQTNKKSNGTNSVKYIMLHHTGPGSFNGITDYLAKSNKSVSAHYTVGLNGELGKIGYDHDILWHAGKGNTKKYGTNLNKSSIGIEVVSDGYKFTTIQVKRLKQLVRSLQEKYNIPNKNIIRHKDYTTRKWDIGDNFFKIVGYDTFESWKEGNMSAMEDLYYKELDGRVSVSNDPESYVKAFPNEETGWKTLIYLNRIKHGY